MLLKNSKSPELLNILPFLEKANYNMYSVKIPGFYDGS